MHPLWCERRGGLLRVRQAGTFALDRSGSDPVGSLMGHALPAHGEDPSSTSAAGLE